MNEFTKHTEIVAAGGDPLYAGVELGGTKCVCTLAFEPGKLVQQITVPTAQAEDTLRAIEEILSGWWQQHGFSALGVASFGPVNLKPGSADFGRILTSNKKGWEGADVASRLSQSFDVPLAFDTDVNGAALAELIWGVGKGCENFAYVTVGTGVGVGHIVHGRPTRGVLGHSEVGHILVPRLAGDNEPSVCAFHDNCVEGLASGTAIKARIGNAELNDLTPENPVWDVVVDALAQMCHALVCVTGPSRIAIGGGVVNKQPHLLARIDAVLRESLGGYIPLPPEPYVVAPGLGDQAGPMGPIAMARNILGTAETA